MLMPHSFKAFAEPVKVVTPRAKSAAVAPVLTARRANRNVRLRFPLRQAGSQPSVIVRSIEGRYHIKTHLQGYMADLEAMLAQAEAKCCSNESELFAAVRSEQGDACRPDERPNGKFFQNR